MVAGAVGGNGLVQQVRVVDEIPGDFLPTHGAFLALVRYAFDAEETENVAAGQLGGVDARLQADGAFQVITYAVPTHL